MAFDGKQSSGDEYWMEDAYEEDEAFDDWYDEADWF